MIIAKFSCSYQGWFSLYFESALFPCSALNFADKKSEYHQEMSQLKIMPITFTYLRFKPDGTQNIIDSTKNELGSSYMGSLLQNWDKTAR